jgi:hypothetical protein
MTRRKKTVLILLSIFPGLPLLLIAAALAIRGCDEPPPADEDLKVKRLQIPDDQNAFTYLQQAAKKLKLPKPDAPLARQAQDGKNEAEGPQNEQELFYEIAAGRRWDGPFVERVLKSNAEALALWEQGMAAPHFQTLEVKTWKEELTHGWSYLPIGNLAMLRARAAAKRGDHEAAFAEGLKLVRFGWRIEGDKGCLIEYLVGIAVHGMGHGLMREMLSGCNLPPARLRHYAAELAKCPADAQGLADAFRNDYEVQWEFVEGLVSDKYTPASVTGPSSPSVRELNPRVEIPWGTMRAAVFNPQATRRVFAETARSRIANVSKAFREMTPEDPTLSEFSLLRDVFSGNTLGRSICRILLPASHGALEQKCRANVDLAATRILLALKAYKLEKAKLPATLAELVPEYLDNVPLDDYDGQPMRYNAAKKVVYSVGKNLTDDGGIGTRADHVAAKRKEAEAAGAKLTDGEQKYAEEEFNEWDQPDACFEIKF